jgi:phosphatidylglycerol:prolipoprotein diacylglycerol transferase
MPLFAIPFPALDPIAISIGPFAIRWYALAYIASLLIGWRYCLALADRPPRFVRRSDIDDFLVWATLGVVFGGRIGYVLFYNSTYYFAHPVEALYLWHGGMSFHGGAIGVTLAIWLFGRTRRVPLLAFGDIICAAVPIGLFFGRIANFINGELWGRPTAAPWGMVFPDAGPLPRHPSQLYEAALEGVVLFCLLRWATHRKKWLNRRGVVLGLFLVGYGIARISLENVREPDSYMPHFPLGLTMGMMLSAPMVLVGAWLMWRGLREPLPPAIAAEEAHLAPDAAATPGANGAA